MTQTHLCETFLVCAGLCFINNGLVDGAIYSQQRAIKVVCLSLAVVLILQPENSWPQKSCRFALIATEHGRIYLCISALWLQVQRCERGNNSSTYASIQTLTSQNITCTYVHFLETNLNLKPRLHSEMNEFTLWGLLSTTWGKPDINLRWTDKKT